MEINATFVANSFDAVGDIEGRRIAAVEFGAVLIDAVDRWEPVPAAGVCPLAACVPHLRGHALRVVALVAPGLHLVCLHGNQRQQYCYCYHSPKERVYALDHGIAILLEI